MARRKRFWELVVLLGAGLVLVSGAVVAGETDLDWLQLSPSSADTYALECLDTSGSAVFTVDPASDVTCAETGGSTSDPDFSVAGYAKFSGVCEFDADVDLDATGGSSSDPDLSVDGYALFGGTLASSGKVIAATAELTISSGSVTVTRFAHTVDTEGDGATDDLDTLSGGSDGQLLLLQAEHTDRTVVIKNGTGNIACGADKSLDSTEDRALLIYDGDTSTWVLIAFSDNG